MNHLARARANERATDLGVSMGTLRLKLTPLLRGHLMLESQNTLTVTPLGKRVLEELGFLTLPPPPTRTHKPEPPKDSPKQMVAHAPKTPKKIGGVVAFLATGVIILIVVAVIGISFLGDMFSAPQAITPCISTSLPGNGTRVTMLFHRQ